ncbi:MAG: DUF2808 domain-containing protein [Leptolyngbyaceae cyanobacterium SU_3_3]|nr:DUF2808 domain-containing protein [Leptolyngbyaceae cyanobacterium SU_3_3]NJR49630.1 DUF2808 domain-containing protein [Leptolyngbyaceae cyanobacterium CSU_1_3]
MLKHFALSLGATLIASVSVGAFAPTQAVQVANGTVYFNSPPRLVGASTTFNSAQAWSATYYFTLDLLENAGEPLQRVTIVQDEGVDAIRFDPKQIEAFEGERNRLGTKIPLGGVTVDRKTRSVSVVFNPPVAPGKRVTIALNPDRNPLSGGVYLFGVTAFPAGEKSHGQFLGFGRLHFYETDFSFRRSIFR